MNSSDSYWNLQCCLTNDHIVEEPISLSCGHCICKVCVKEPFNPNCKICLVETDKSKIKVRMEPEKLKETIKSSLS